MHKRDAALYLADIKDSIKKIESYVKKKTFKQFCNDQIVIDAVVRNLEIIGEAANNIPKKLRNDMQIFLGAIL